MMLDDSIAIIYQHAIQSLNHVLACLSVGVVLVDRGLRIRMANAVAEEILAAGDGIGVAAGRLRVTAPAQREELKARLQAIGRVSDQAGSAGDDALYLPRPSGLPALSVTMLSGAGMRTEAAAPNAFATLVISDPMRGKEQPSAESLSLRFGLTWSEARVARLAPLALSKRQTAERLGLSENTVKSHLANARDKIGARNMSELAVIIGRLPPPFGDREKVSAGIGGSNHERRARAV
jgi:DNA-binding CsgD family transcriptional regulator